jgi:predicted cupin superfamily sugar epimerase
MDAASIIAALGLTPHPEGGHFTETWRDAHSTAIYFLLKAGERSHWHRVDATEIWHFHAGAPLRLRTAHDGVITEHRLGPAIAGGERPQAIVPPHHWQAAESLGAWTLVGCTVAPPFRFEGFELATPGWSP